MTSPDLNISLEPHLIENLLPLRTILPSGLSTQLDPYLTEPAPRTIPYSLLSSISQWSRSSSGQAALQSHRPPLHAQAYSMIFLLAGTVTSPERRFPPHVPKYILTEEERKRQITDRKAIATLVNALLSVAGSGIATWLVAERWRNEWVCYCVVLPANQAELTFTSKRVLLSFLVAVVVAISETILYIIWQSRRSGKRKRRAISSQRKKTDGDKKISSSVDVPDIPHRNMSTPMDGQTIRLRQPATITQDE